ncbi:MAG: hypothetical protein JWN57_2869 [Frankiales bacterium]|jgi:hypothetical protein|nr:hypothetical protein [Frankiales bacterium]
MLTQVVVVAALSLSAHAALAGAAAATDAPVVVDGDNNAGVVDTTVTAPSVPGAIDAARPVGPRVGDVTCVWTENPSYAESLSLWDGLGTAEPGGRWYDVACSDGSNFQALYVPPASDSVPPPVVLAGTLARTLTSRLRLPSPVAGRSPAGWALVGLPTWFWVEPGSWRTLRQRTSVGPVWAEVVATPVSTTWEPGDGSAPFTCAGPGTVYDRSRPEGVQSTACSYAYRRSSADQPQTGPSDNDRFFTVTVTSRWQVTWTGSGGTGGTLPVLTRSSSFPVAVAQRQTVVTGGSG